MNIVLAAINAKYIHSNLAVYSLRAYAQQYKDVWNIQNRPALNVWVVWK